MQKVQIELTAEEAQVFINLIDIAVKTRGLEAAQSGLLLVGKVQQAVQAATEKEQNIAKAQAALLPPLKKIEEVPAKKTPAKAAAKPKK